MRITNLRLIAEIIEELTQRKAEVKDLWLDYGAKIYGQNIVIEDDYQLLSPRQLEEGLTLAEVEEEVRKIIKRGW